MFFEILTSLILIWIVQYIITTFMERKNLPPGPFPLPIIGNLHQIGNYPPFTMKNLTKHYPDVMTLKFPMGNVVVLNSAAAAEEAMVTKKTDFAGRPVEDMYPVDVVFEGKDVLTTDYGELLAFRRKVFRSALNLFGEGTRELEERLNGATIRLLNQIEEIGNRPFRCRTLIHSAIASQLWQWLSNVPLPHSDPMLLKIIEFQDTFIQIALQGNIIQLFPLLKYLPTEFSRKLMYVVQTRDELFGSLLDDHKKTYKKGIVRDVTDGFLAAYDMEKERNPSKDIGCKDDIKYLMMNVLSGGSDTSVGIIDWTILYLVLMEDIQEKVYVELENVIEKDGLPHLDDTKNMHYLHAVVCEILRMTSYFPFLVPHRTIRDTNVMGHRVPKMTTVLINQFSIHYDSKGWDEPKVFKPERFLDNGGNFVGWNKHKAFIPFGFGRRSCPGQDIAKIQVFKILPSLLYHFKFKLPDGKPTPSLDDSTPGAVRNPAKYQVVAIKRH